MIKFKYLIGLTTLIMALCTEGGYAAPILERYVSLKANNMALKEALKIVANQAGFYLSYNTNIIDENKKVSLNTESEKVRIVLKNILGNNYQFKEKGNYLIIQKLNKNEQLIGGYISDKKTGKKLPNVTVYDKKTLTSATTDSSGYYEIITKKPIEKLSIARYNYGDTVLQIKSEKAFQDLDVSLLPIPNVDNPVDNSDIVEKPVDNSNQQDKYTEQTIISNGQINQAIRWSIKEIEHISERNVKESFNRKWQFSLAPYLGSNFGLSGNVINKWSVNATVGYSRGNTGVEIGGIGNINQGNVRGIQVGGIFNITKGRMQAVQAAGILNRTRYLNGLQISGLTNYTDTASHSVQIAGINNHTEWGKKSTVQVSGMVNKTEYGRTTLQIAPIVNTADTVGIQIGLINNANKLKGVQIGLINIADTASGVLLGLLNIVKKGYHVLEVSHNDITDINLAYRTGTRRFYSIYAIGSDIQTKKLLGIGSGLGTSFWLGKVIALTIDATGHRYWINSALENKGGLIKITPALNIQFTKNIGIGIAPTWNNYFINASTHSPSDIDILKSTIIPQKASFQNNRYEWWGWSIGLRFF